jgi:hypothetical protein
VGAEPGVFGIAAGEADGPLEVVDELSDRRSGFGERMYQIAHARNKMETMKIAKRARMRKPF